MDNNLGEVFYNGKICTLSTMQENEMRDMLENLRSKQVVKKEAIRENLNKMREEF